MAVQTIEDVLVEELKDLYHAEKQLTKALPKMAKGAFEPDLKKAFQDHLEETQGHVQRLDQVFSLLGEASKGKKCEGMEGLIAEGDEVKEEHMPEACNDVALIAAAQKVEHYEIAGYGTVRALAEQLGKEDVAQLLQETLDEEKAADEKLTEICQTILSHREEPEAPVADRRPARMGHAAGRRR